MAKELNSYVDPAFCRLQVSPSLAISCGGRYCQLNGECRRQSQGGIKLRKLTLMAATGVVALIGLASAAEAIDIRLMTGPQAGIWVPLGGQLKDVWENDVPDVNVQLLPGAGIANVRGIEEGKAELGFANTISTADAVAGTGEPPLDKKHSKVCNVATLYPQYFQLVVAADAGISTLMDIKGKGFATQVKGNTGELIARHVLKVSGMTYDDVKASFTNSYTDSVEQMKDNRSHAFALGTGIPASSIMDLAAARDIKLLDLSSIYEDIKKINPAYKLATIPQGTYPKQDTDVQVIGYDTHIIAACSLPEDTVYAMTAALASNKETMASVYQEMGKLSPQIMAQDIDVPFHPGAAKWYKENGITVQ
jgi:TRAP transporter TAXI family solute receptor